MRLTAHVAGFPRQQAPGFWAQKSSNCCASEPAGGGESEFGLSWVPGALAPPLPELPELGVVAPPVPVLVPVEAVPVPVLVPVEPDCVLGAVVPDDGVGVAVGVAVAVALLDAASPSELGSDGMVTATGGPGTSW